MTTATARRDTLLQQYEALWSALDELFAGMSRQDWQRKHGPHWVMADLPYHLSYFDRDLIVAPMKAGSDIPLEKRWTLSSLNDINAWNAREFAQRPADQTVEQALAAMGESRAAIRRELARLTDDELTRRHVWDPFTGWTPIGEHVQGGIGHTWNHVNEAHLRMKQGAPNLPASVNRAALTFYMALMRAFANPGALGGKPLTVTYDYGESGAWTIAVTDTGAQLRDGTSEQADVTMTTTPVYFSAMMTKAANPMLLMLTRKIKIKGMRNMGRMGKVFAEPSPDQAILPVNHHEPDLRLA